ncbi:hypothetical protein LTR60_006567, partial [Cryomyces antarcticus]
GFGLITHRALSMLKRLAEKTKGSELGLSGNVLPKRETVLGALLTPNIDAVALRQLCALSGLE